MSKPSTSRAIETDSSEQDRQEVSLGDLATKMLRNSVLLYTSSRSLVTGRVGLKGKYVLSRLGYVSTAVSAVTAAYAVYEVSRELLGRPEVQELLVEAGEVVTRLRDRVRGKADNLYVRLTLAENHPTLTPAERRAIADGMSQKQQPL